MKKMPALISINNRGEGMVLLVAKPVARQGRKATDLKETAGLHVKCSPAVYFRLLNSVFDRLLV